MRGTWPLPGRLIRICFIPFLLFATVQNGSAADTTDFRQGLKQWIDTGSVLLHDENGRVLLSYQADHILVPASLVKIYTALIAMEELGADFRFKTEIYSNTRGDICIKGWGDPQLISEEIHLIAEALKKKGVRQVRHIRLDQTAFAKRMRVAGQSNSLNPYDAINSALVVNYNTLYLGRRRDGTVVSAEPVTPLTPLARDLGKTLKPGTTDRFNLSTDRKNISRYAAELFAAILTKHGVSVTGGYAGESRADRQWSRVYTHYNSAPLHQVVRGLLKYSNNLIANQIYLVAGAETAGYPATLHKARAVFKGFFRDHFPDHAGQTIIDEASGISRKNRMSAVAVMAVLEAFRPWADLLRTKRGVLVKSGTLTGVYNYAGYIKTAKGYRPFVILLNQRKNTRDRILRSLIRWVVPMNAGDRRSQAKR